MLFFHQYIYTQHIHAHVYTTGLIEEMRRNIEKKLKLTFSKVMKLEQGNIKREELKYQ